MNPITFVDTFDDEVGYKCRCGARPIIKAMDHTFLWHYWCRVCLERDLCSPDPSLSAGMLCTALIELISVVNKVDKLTGFRSAGESTPTVAEVNQLRAADGREPFKPMTMQKPGVYGL